MNLREQFRYILALRFQATTRESMNGAKLDGYQTAKLHHGTSRHEQLENAAMKP
jgi:hypothetical protein